MQPDAFDLKRSPFVFLKTLFLIVFFFALIPVLVNWIFAVEESYTTTGLARSLPYDFLMTVVVTLLQLVIILVAFLGWYIPTYRVTEDEIILDRGDFFGLRKVAATQSIQSVDIRQGWLGRRFNYGTLLLRDAAGAELGRIQNVPSPILTAEEIRELVDPPGMRALDLLELPAQELIVRGEGQYVEFKSSLIWDYRQERANKALYEPVMKNVTAFLNSKGGVVLIGVADDGSILGLEPDMRTLKQPDIDRWELLFNNAFNAMIGVQYRRFVELVFPTLEDKVICQVNVRPCPKPTYLNHNNAEYFYIRAGNGTQPLSMSKANEYIRDHFAD